MTLLIAEDVNLLRGIFLVGELSKFWLLPERFDPIPGFPKKV